MRSRRLPTLMLLSASVCVSSCDWFYLSPLEVRDCKVVRTYGNTMLSAEVRNRSDRAMRFAKLVVVTSGIESDVVKKDGEAEYDLMETIPPKTWTTRSAVAGPFASHDSVRQRLGAVTQCYAMNVQFDDGSMWQGPSPE